MHNSLYSFVVSFYSFFTCFSHTLKLCMCNCVYNTQKYLSQMLNVFHHNASNFKMSVVHQSVSRYSYFKLHPFLNHSEISPNLTGMIIGCSCLNAVLRIKSMATEYFLHLLVKSYCPIFNSQKLSHSLLVKVSIRQRSGIDSIKCHT